MIIFVQEGEHIMINLDTNGFENPEVALMECSCYIYNCFSEKDRQQIKADWESAGGVNTMPWWKWCIEHCHVSYDN